MAVPEASLISADQKARLHEVADLLTTILETLVELRYLSPASIIRGPHDLDEPRKDYDGEELDPVRKQCQKLGMDPAIIYLYSIMPYVDEHESGVGDFFQGGGFFNQLKYRDVQRSRDPCYASPQGDYEHQHGQYMYPWYTPLSDCGNHCSVIIYDAREHRVWIVDQIQRHSTDPAISRGWYGNLTKQEEEKEATWGDSGDESDWCGDDDDGGDDDDDDDDLVSNGSSEFWADEDEFQATNELTGLEDDRAEEVDFDEGFDVVEEPSEWEMFKAKTAYIKNQNSLELARHRPAADVLQDINRYYRELYELPGHGERSHGVWTIRPETTRRLYQEAGWPDHFDAERFEINQLRVQAAEKAARHAEGPLNCVRQHDSWSEHATRDVEKEHEAVAVATNIEDEWKARWALYQAEERQRDNIRDLAKARERAAILCPNGVCQKEEDLPLWEAEQLRVDLRSSHTLLERAQNDSQRERRQRELAMCEKAYAASKADAERLCPGKTFERATGVSHLGGDDVLTRIQKRKESFDVPERLIRSLKEFGLTVPEEATKARGIVQKEIEKTEERIRKIHADIDRMEKWMAENGNTY